MGRLQTILKKVGILEMLSKPNHELIKPETYGWIKNEDIENSYYLEIFKKNERNMAKHQMVLFYKPENKVKLKPLTIKEKNAMWFGNAQGPLRDMDNDSLLSIGRYETFDGYLLKFLAYFYKGEFQYAEEHSTGLGDVRSLYSDFHNVKDFKKRMVRHFDICDYKEFSGYFLKSNLPESSKNSIRDILV